MTPSPGAMRAAPQGDSSVMTRRPRSRPALYVPWDIEVARLNFGANCGPAAFAASTEREVCRVMRHFPHFVTSNWTTLTHMRRAFLEAGYEVNVQKRAMPTLGVALVQWLGPWTERDFFSRWSLFHTHWIAVHGGHVFDHTIGEWQTLAAWENTAAAEFIADTPRATGWSVKYGVDAFKARVVVEFDDERPIAVHSSVPVNVSTLDWHLSDTQMSDAQIDKRNALADEAKRLPFCVRF